MNNTFIAAWPHLLAIRAGIASAIASDPWSAYLTKTSKAALLLCAAIVMLSFRNVENSKSLCFGLSAGYVVLAFLMDASVPASGRLAVSVCTGAMFLLSWHFLMRIAGNRL